MLTLWTTPRRTDDVCFCYTRQLLLQLQQLILLQMTRDSMLGQLIYVDIVDYSEMYDDVCFCYTRQQLQQLQQQLLHNSDFLLILYYCDYYCANPADIQNKASIYLLQRLSHQLFDGRIKQSTSFDSVKISYNPMSDGP